MHSEEQSGPEEKKPWLDLFQELADTPLDPQAMKEMYQAIEIPNQARMYELLKIDETEPEQVQRIAD